MKEICEALETDLEAGRSRWMRKSRVRMYARRGGSRRRKFGESVGWFETKSRKGTCGGQSEGEGGAGVEKLHFLGTRFEALRSQDSCLFLNVTIC